MNYGNKKIISFFSLLLILLLTMPGCSHYPILIYSDMLITQNKSNNGQSNGQNEDKKNKDDNPGGIAVGF